VAPDLGNVVIERLVEQQAVLALTCHACRHRATWGPAELKRRFSGQFALSVRSLARRLRCQVCRSEWIEVSRERAVQSRAAGA
jgi:hypothetical protein